MDNNETTFRLIDWFGGIIMGLLSLLYGAQTLQIRELKKDHGDAINRQRDSINKLFDRMEAGRQATSDQLTQMAKDSADRGERMVAALHAGLDKKVDKT